MRSTFPANATPVISSTSALSPRATTSAVTPRATTSAPSPRAHTYMKFAPLSPGQVTPLSPSVQGDFRSVARSTPVRRASPPSTMPRHAVVQLQSSPLSARTNLPKTPDSLTRTPLQAQVINSSTSVPSFAWYPATQSAQPPVTYNAGDSMRSSVTEEGDCQIRLAPPLSLPEISLNESVPPPPEPFDNKREPVRSNKASSRRAAYTREGKAYDLEHARNKDRELTGQHSVTSWLGWAPRQNSPCYKALHEHFPGALPAPLVHARIMSALDDFGMTDENTIFGCSTCPDEINSEPGGLVSLMEDAWGKLFPMGGISGVPFAGKTGFIAFSHHVPDDGNVLVLFGPHVGVSEDGDIGKVLRCGQCAKSTACGAVIGAYKSCLGNNIKDVEFDPTDMQMDWIKKNIQPVADEISQQEEPMAALAHQSYKFVEEEILKVVNTKFGTGNLILVGGIMINMPQKHTMHFLPRFFEMRREGAAPINLMESFEFRCHDPCIRRFVNDFDDEIALKAKILGSLNPFKDSSTHDRIKAARSLVQMSYYKGEAIMNQGDMGNSYCILLSGEVAVEVDGKERKRLSGLLRMDDDDIAEQVQELMEGRALTPVVSFGELALVGGPESRRSATIRVVSEHAIVDMMTRSQFLLLNKRDDGGEIVDGSTITFNFQAEKQKVSAHPIAHHVFSHMGWSPNFDTESFRALHEFFPGALPSHAMYSRILEAITGERFGLTPANTILGTSICPDEINTTKFSLPQLMKSHWGKCFPLGGISGAPFSGKTGFTAFSHHVPDNGNVIVLFGPHVGVSASGEVGKVHRDGQRCESTSCGAVVGAYKACLDNSFSSDDFDASDMQMCWIKSKIGPKVNFLKAFENPLAMLSHFAFEMVKAKIRQVVNNEFSSGYLVLIGGIQINMLEPYCEHFLPYMFEVSKRGEFGHIDLKSVFDAP